MKKQTYNTKQRTLILDLLKKYDREFTVKEIYENISDTCGLTTVYRVIDKLFEDGLIKKIVGENGSIYYQYLDNCSHENHFYLKCNNCGKLIHIDCDCIVDLKKHILDEHKFSLLSKNIIIDGLCSNCIEGGK